MKLYSPLGTLLVTILLLLTAISSSDSPPANTIPIISMKTGQGETSLDITLTTASDTLRAVAADLGPWNLSELSGSWTGDIKKLWLVFNGAGNLSTDIRIGWVKLTE